MNWKKIIGIGIVFAILQVIYTEASDQFISSDSTYLIFFFIVTAAFSVAFALWLMKGEKSELVRTAFIAGLAWAIITTVIDYLQILVRGGFITQGAYTIIEYISMWEVWVAFVEKIIVPPIVALFLERKLVKPTPPRIMK